MRAILAFALVAMTSALPKPEVFEPVQIQSAPIPANIDFRPLIVANEVNEAVSKQATDEIAPDVNQSDLTVHIVDAAINEKLPDSEATVVHFDNSHKNIETNNDDIIHVANLVINADPISDDTNNIANSVIINKETQADPTENAVEFVNSPLNEDLRVAADDAGGNIHFINFPIAQDDGIAERVVDTTFDELSDDDTAVLIVDSLDKFDAVNFINIPFESDMYNLIRVSDVLLNRYEKIRASELKTIRFVHIPSNTEGMLEVKMPKPVHLPQHYLGKIYDDPVLR